MAAIPRRTVMRAALGVSLAGMVSLVAGCSTESPPRKRGVLVYGGTPSGIAAAIAVARAGVDVTLLLGESPLGGMMTNGLGRSDIAKNYLPGGIADDYFKRVGTTYGKTGPVYNFEPHVAESVFQAMLAKYDVVPQAGVVESVIKSGGVITSIRMTDGSSIDADVFIDASYEGTLIQSSGVQTTYGRESSQQYSEARGGYGYHFTSVKLKGTDDTGRRSAGLTDTPAQVVGSADQKIMAYNYRLCVTDDLSQAVPFAAAPDYDPAQFDLLSRSFTASIPFTLRVWPVSDHKFDLNGGGFFDTDAIGQSWSFPTSDLAGRRSIADAHKNYTMNLLHFLGNDRSVPVSVRDEIQKYGLAADEFATTAQWPTQLYIRETVRMVGSSIMTEADILTATKKDDSIATGAYALDSHFVQRYVDRTGNVALEGTLPSADVVTGYEIPYRALIPKPDDASNLLSSVCISASHVAWASLRVEPTFLAIGEAAGEAAALAAEGGTSVHDVSVSELQSRLKAHGAVITI